MAPKFPPAFNPYDRVKIRQRRLPAQPHSLLMKLPLELRERIYEHALGARVVGLALRASWHNRRVRAVQSARYEVVDRDVPHGRPPVLRRADPLPTALLRVCRQIYFEALPVLHHRTTFHPDVFHHKAVLDTSLRSHYLSEICSLYLCHSYAEAPPPWEAVFAVLHKMRLDCLVFEFHFVQLEGRSSTQRRMCWTARGGAVCSRCAICAGLTLYSGTEIHQSI
ncbi:hypothetical protein C8J57DRAFT_1619036 [Mycena rebaudengoi]|nr:hypothetical protein C8J57DRAFT_1619036 [Mycena rebaudengoi]